MCFTLGYLEQLVIWLIIVAAIIAVIQLLLPMLDTAVAMPIVSQVVRIILWAVVAIFIVIIIFSLLSCLLGGAGTLGFPHPR